MNQKFIIIEAISERLFRVAFAVRTGHSSLHPCSACPARAVPCTSFWCKFRTGSNLLSWKLRTGFVWQFGKMQDENWRYSRATSARGVSGELKAPNKTDSGNSRLNPGLNPLVEIKHTTCFITKSSRFRQRGSLASRLKYSRMRENHLEHGRQG